MSYYEAGHMMYTNKESRLQLKADIAKFMRARSQAPSVTP
jgi:carboxypeptidase C (cathepsin A)